MAWSKIVDMAKSLVISNEYKNEWWSVQDRHALVPDGPQTPSNTKKFLIFCYRLFLEYVGSLRIEQHKWVWKKCGVHSAPEAYCFVSKSITNLINTTEYNLRKPYHGCRTP